MRQQRLDSTPNGIPCISQPSGFVTTHLVCMPCGERIAMPHVADDDVMAFVLEHRAHINGVDPDEPMQTRRPAWRSKR